jgi:hypothetical protein
MADDAWYSPTYKPPPARTLRRPGELFWTVHHDHALWTGELKFHGESYGWEAIVLRDGELVISQRLCCASTRSSGARNSGATSNGAGWTGSGTLRF